MNFVLQSDREHPFVPANRGHDCAVSWRAPWKKISNFQRWSLLLPPSARLAAFNSRLCWCLSCLAARFSNLTARFARRRSYFIPRFSSLRARFCSCRARWLSWLGPGSLLSNSPCIPGTVGTVLEPVVPRALDSAPVSGSHLRSLWPLCLCSLEGPSSKGPPGEGSSRWGRGISGSSEAVERMEDENEDEDEDDDEEESVESDRCRFRWPLGGVGSVSLPRSSPILCRR